VDEPFALIQSDVKDVHAKGSLGTQHTTHLRRQHLPRYQWTACDGRTRMRFLAFSHTLNRTHGLAFLIRVLRWLRAFGVATSVTFQTDWGEELSQRFLMPLGRSPAALPPGA
jgi:hypothetical protein